MEVVCVHSFYTRKYSHFVVWNAKGAENIFNSQGNTVIEKVIQIPSKTKISSCIEMKQ